MPITELLEIPDVGKLIACPKPCLYISYVDVEGKTKKGYFIKGQYLNFPTVHTILKEFPRDHPG